MSCTAIVSALHEELAAVLGLMPDEHKTVHGGRTFWRGHLHGHEVVAVLSRIGKVAAATTATALIERFNVSRIVFTGVAGGLGQGVRVGDVVLAKEFLQHDLDVSPLYPRHQVPLYGCSRFATDADLTGQLAAAVQAVLARPLETLGADAATEFGLAAPRAHHGLVLSGDRFVSTRQESEMLRRELPDALAVEMEGAAIAQVCHDYGVPFAALRTVSDRADEVAHVDFARFITQVASRYSAALLDHYFRAL